MPLNDMLPAPDSLDIPYEDKAACLRIRERLHRYNQEFTWDFLWRESSDFRSCTSVDSCEAARLRSLRRTSSRLSLNAYSWHPFTPCNWKTLEKELCSSCSIQCTRYYSDGRRRFWDELPRLFGLGTWEMLKAEVGGQISHFIPVRL